MQMHGNFWGLPHSGYKPAWGWISRIAATPTRGCRGTASGWWPMTMQTTSHTALNGILIQWTLYATAQPIKGLQMECAYYLTLDPPPALPAASQGGQLGNDDSLPSYKQDLCLWHAHVYGVQNRLRDGQGLTLGQNCRCRHSLAAPHFYKSKPPIPPRTSLVRQKKCHKLTESAIPCGEHIICRCKLPGGMG